MLAFAVTGRPAGATLTPPLSAAVGVVAKTLLLVVYVLPLVVAVTGVPGNSVVSKMASRLPMARTMNPAGAVWWQA